MKSHIPEALPIFKEVKKILKGNDILLHELSLQWAVQLPEISKIIIGIDSLDQLKINLSCMDKKLNSRLVQELLNLRYENENVLNPSNWRKN